MAEPTQAPTTKVDQLTSVLKDANAIFGQLVPLVGVVSGMARLIIALAKRNGVSVGTFGQEVTKLEAASEALKAASADFRLKYGYSDGETPPPSEAPVSLTGDDV